MARVRALVLLIRGIVIATLVSGGVLAATTAPAGAGFEVAVATATLQAADAAGVLTPIGTVSFQQGNGAVTVRVDVRANSVLKPGFHGTHVHDVGSCVGPAFTSAAGHYNPAGASHGAHAGDLPVLLVQPDGSAHAIDTTTLQMTIAAGLPPPDSVAPLRS